MGDPSWVPFITAGTVTGDGTVADIGGKATALALAPGEVVGVWVRFISGAGMSRPTDSNLIAMGTRVTDNAPGDPTFSYTEQGYLRLSAAMQAKAPDSPNWDNVRPYVGSFTYTASS